METIARPGFSLRAILSLIIVAWCCAVSPRLGAAQPARPAAEAAAQISVPILVYHRIAPTVTDEMTVTINTFESQLRFLRDNHYTVIPLHALVDYLRGAAPAPPARAVVIVADDGHISVFRELYPRIKRERIPVTLFIYPSAISNASYAMTWPQLAELKASGLFAIESHTYWHPNFHVEKRRLAPAAYRAFVDMQFTKSKQVLEHRLDAKVDLLSWPFGIYDDELIAIATKAGYVAAFTIDRRNVSRRDNLMALPRYIVTDHDTGRTFERLLSGNAAEPARRIMENGYEN